MTDPLSRLAERGRPAGAAALLTRVEASLSTKSRRRPTGPVLAALVFAVVIVIGVLGRLVIAPPTVFVDSGIDWHRFETQFYTLDMKHGPGGFVRAGVHLYYSADGESWEEVDPPGYDWHGLRGLLHTEDVWLLTAGENDPDRGWVSSDGRSWSPVELPSGGQPADYVWGGGRFFLMRSTDSVTESFWLSEDGVSWTPLELPTGVGGYTFATVTEGLVWFELSGADAADVSLTLDGVTWSTGSIPAPESPSGWDWHVLRIEQIGDRWVAIGESFDGDDQSVGQVWTSDDGLSWTWQGSELGFLPATWMVSVAGDVLAIAASADPSTPEGREVWATNDGVSWQKVLEADRDIWFFGVGTDANGELVGVWMPRPVPEGESGPETTMIG